MAVLKTRDFKGFLNNIPSGPVAVLIYGPDAGGVRDRTAELVKTVAGSTDDPFNVVRLTDRDIAADPATLPDEVNAMSLAGGRRAIWVSDPGNASLAALSDLLEQPKADSLVVVQAGNLARSSKLRQLFESHKLARAMGCYEESDSELRQIIKSEASAHGLRIENETITVLLDLLGADQALTRSELNKLITYCHGSSAITSDDVISVSGDAAAISVDEALDAAFAGEAGLCCRHLARAQGSGLAASRILSLASLHVARLQSMKLQVDQKGASPDRVVQSARPPIHFKRRDAFTRQLQRWSVSQLQQAAAGIYQAILGTRLTPGLDSQTCERAFLAIAHRASRTSPDRR